MKKLTAADIEYAFTNTCDHASGYTLESSIRGDRGCWMDIVYSLTTNLSLNGFNFNVHLLHSDGGVRDFLLLYRIGNFDVIIQQFKMFDDRPFHTVEGMVKWFNAKEESLMATCVLVKCDLKLESI